MRDHRSPDENLPPAQYVNCSLQCIPEELETGFRPEHKAVLGSGHRKQKQSLKHSTKLDDGNLRSGNTQGNMRNT